MPSAHPSHAVTTHGLRFTWPDGTAVLSGSQPGDPQGRSGLVGVNGSGKSTLLRLLAGVLAPTVGQVSTPLGQVGYLAQDLIGEDWSVEQRAAGILGRLRLYVNQVETEQAAAEQAVTTARADMAKQRSNRVDAERADPTMRSSRPSVPTAGLSSWPATTPIFST